MLTLSSDLDTICNVVNDVVPNLEEVSSSHIYIYLLYFPSYFLPAKNIGAKLNTYKTRKKYVGLFILYISPFYN